MRNGVIVAIAGVVCLSAMSALDAVVMPHERSGAHVVRMIGDAAGYRFEPASIAISVGDSVVFEVADVPPGRYPFYCVPHLALHMRGEVIVR